MPRTATDITGQRFGKLVAVIRNGSSANGDAMWNCECDCGGAARVRGSHLRRGLVTCCGGKGNGCRRKEKADMTGRVFGRLTVVRFGGYKDEANRMYRRWECLCECGNLTTVGRTELVKGQTKSCGCYSRELTLKRSTKHGKYYTVECEMVNRVKGRAKKLGLPFDLDISDIVIPYLCPLLGIVLERGRFAMQEASPTVDRIRPDLGYVKGNVWVISQRANRMKGDHTVETMKHFVRIIEQASRDLVSLNGTRAAMEQ